MNAHRDAVTDAIPQVPRDPFEHPEGLLEGGGVKTDQEGRDPTPEVIAHGTAEVLAARGDEVHAGDTVRVEVNEAGGEVVVGKIHPLGPMRLPHALGGLPQGKHLAPLKEHCRGREHLTSGEEVRPHEQVGLVPGVVSSGQGSS